MTALAAAAEYREEEPEPQPQEPRLYSAPRLNIAVDEIAPHHAGIHRKLERWGMWNRAPYSQGSCYSVESRYREQTPRATGSDVSHEMITMERVVLRMPDPYRALTRMFYVTRESPGYICKALAIRKQSFAAYTYRARSMAINILRSICV